MTLSLSTLFRAYVETQRRMSWVVLLRQNEKSILVDTDPHAILYQRAHRQEFKLRVRIGARIRTLEAELDILRELVSIPR